MYTWEIDHSLAVFCDDLFSLSQLRSHKCMGWFYWSKGRMLSFFFLLNPHSKACADNTICVYCRKIRKNINYPIFKHLVLFCILVCILLHFPLWKHTDLSPSHSFATCFPHLPIYWESFPILTSTSLFSVAAIPGCINLCSVPYVGYSGFNLSLL